MYQLSKEFTPVHFRKLSEEARRDKRAKEVADKLFQQFTNAANSGATSTNIDLTQGTSTVEADRYVIQLIKDAGFEVIPNTASMGKFLIKW